MENYFDQFDEKTSGGNYFDQFDEAGTATGVKPQEASGFLDRVGQAYDKRGQMAQEIANRGVENNLPNGLIGYEMLGTGVGGFVKDVGLEALNAASPYIQKAGSYLPGIESYDKGMTTIVDTAKPAIQPAAQFVGEQYNKLPQGVRDFTDATGNLLGAAATVAPVYPLAKAGAEAITGGISAGDAAKATAGAFKRTPITTADDVFLEADKAFKVVKESNSAITPGGVNGFLQEAKQKIITDPKVAGVTGTSAADKYLRTGGDSGKGLESLADGKTLSIQQVHAIDKDLSQQITKRFTDGLDSEGQQLMELQDTFRKYFYAPDPRNFTGGKGGFDAWIQANDLYHKASKMSAVRKVVDNAKLTDNPASSIKTGMRNILKSAKKTRGYTAEELAALEKAAETGLATDALRTFGGRLMTLAGTVGGLAIGGPIGAAAGGAVSYVGGRLMRGGATAIQKRGADNLIKIMGKDATFKPEGNPSLYEKSKTKFNTERSGRKPKK